MPIWAISGIESSGGSSPGRTVPSRSTSRGLRRADGSCGSSAEELVAPGVGAVVSRVASGRGWVYSGTRALPCPAAPEGVGSNGSQPTPSKYSSGQEWESFVPTSHRSPDLTPPV